MKVTLLLLFRDREVWFYFTNKPFVVLKRFELLTLALEEQCSIQLSYKTLVEMGGIEPPSWV